MRHLATILSFLILILAGPARAQLVPGLPITVEVRPSAAVPVGEFGDAHPGLGAGTGFGVAAKTLLHVTSRIAVYGGYEYARFDCGECTAAGLEDGLPEAGFEAGIRGVLPYRPWGLDPWLEAGALIGREIEISGAGGDLASAPALGWSAGAGVSVPLGGSLRLTPGLRYRTHSAEFAFTDLGFGLLGSTGTFTRDVDVASLSLEVGVAYEF